jgi:hypothetical protein
VVLYDYGAGERTVASAGVGAFFDCVERPQKHRSKQYGMVRGCVGEDGVVGVDVKGVVEGRRRCGAETAGIWVIQPWSRVWCGGS